MIVTLKSLGIHSDKKIYKEYLWILNLFLSKQNYQYIILCWSFAKMKLEKWSDIDIFIIDESAKQFTQTREIINEIEIDVLKCSIQKAIDILDDEKNSYLRRISDLLSSWKPLSSTKKLHQLISSANQSLNYQVPKLETTQKEEIKNFIITKKLLAKKYLEKYSDISFYSRFSYATQTALTYYFQLNKQLLPNRKSTGESISPGIFKDQLNKFYISSTKQEKYDCFLSILGELERLLKNYK